MTKKLLGIIIAIAIVMTGFVNVNNALAWHGSISVKPDCTGWLIEVDTTWVDENGYPWVGTITESGELSGTWSENQSEVHWYVVIEWRDNDGNLLDSWAESGYVYRPDPSECYQKCSQTVTISSEWSEWQADPNNQALEYRTREVIYVDAVDNAVECGREIEKEWRDKPYVECEETVQQIGEWSEWIFESESGQEYRQRTIRYLDVADNSVICNEEIEKEWRDYEVCVFTEEVVSEWSQWTVDSENPRYEYRTRVFTTVDANSGAICDSREERERRNVPLNPYVLFVDAACVNTNTAEFSFKVSDQFGDPMIAVPVQISINETLVDEYQTDAAGNLRLTLAVSTGDNILAWVNGQTAEYTVEESLFENCRPTIQVEIHSEVGCKQARVWGYTNIAQTVFWEASDGQNGTTAVNGSFDIPIYWSPVIEGVYGPHHLRAYAFIEIAGVRWQTTSEEFEKVCGELTPPPPPPPVTTEVKEEVEIVDEQIPAIPTDCSLLELQLEIDRRFGQSNRLMVYIIDEDVRTSPVDVAEQVASMYFGAPIEVASGYFSPDNCEVVFSARVWGSKDPFRVFIVPSRSSAPYRKIGPDDQMSRVVSGWTNDWWLIPFVEVDPSGNTKTMAFNQWGGQLMDLNVDNSKSCEHSPDGNIMACEVGGAIVFSSIKNPQLEHVSTKMIGTPIAFSPNGEYLFFINGRTVYRAYLFADGGSVVEYTKLADELAFDEDGGQSGVVIVRNESELYAQISPPNIDLSTAEADHVNILTLTVMIHSQDSPDWGDPVNRIKSTQISLEELRVLFAE